LKEAKQDDPKVVILISSLMTWAGTPSKLELTNPPPVEEAGQDEEEERPTSKLDSKRDVNTSRQGLSSRQGLNSSRVEEDRAEEAPAEEVPPPEPEYQRRPHTEADWESRQPLDKYRRWKELEDLVLSAGEHLQTYVICAGLLYGLGEYKLSSHFRAAWLENPRALPYVGEGTNYVHAVHVTDLAKCVKFVIENKPEVKYLLGIDNSPDPTQLALVQALSSGIGTGLVESVKFESVKDEIWAPALNIDLWLKPSEIFIPTPTEDNEDPEMPFEWHSLKGLAANIAKVNQEFNMKSGLRAIKVVLLGPPAVGKSFYAQDLAEHYNTVHIKVADVLAEISREETELGLQVKEELRQKHRIPDDIVAEAIRWRLNAGQCRNRGYVLDGWPKTYEQAKLLFMKRTLKASEEEEEEVNEAGSQSGEGEGPAVSKPLQYDETLDADIFPQSVVFLRSEDEYLHERVKKFPEHLVAKTHYTEPEMLRRLTAYRQANDDSSGNITTQDFFIEKGLTVGEVDAFDSTEEVFESLRILIEREGRPYNYLKSSEELDFDRGEFIEHRELKHMAMLAFESERQQAIQAEANNQHLIQTMLAYEQAKKLERESAAAKALPLKQFLMEALVPVLAEGLLETCKTAPEDPIEFLAEFMDGYSRQVS
jgi:adenylate kinase